MTVHLSCSPGKGNRAFPLAASPQSCRDGADWLGCCFTEKVQGGTEVPVLPWGSVWSTIQGTDPGYTARDRGVTGTEARVTVPQQGGC